VIYRVDIDGTICCNVDDHDYRKSLPYVSKIAKMNKLYDEGHTIIYWTSRGSLSGQDWDYITKWQLKEWGVKYHEVLLDKPYFDIFIDDRAVSSIDELEI